MSARAFSSRLSSASDASFLQGVNKICHKKILEASQSKSEYEGGIVAMYRKEVLSQKTRTVRLLGTKCSARIIQSLLGFEVQARHKRIQCPDLVTARYLKIFSEIGCHTVRLPYDPTLTERIIPQMESAYQNIEATVKKVFPHNPKLHRYVIQKIFAIIREEIRDAA